VGYSLRKTPQKKMKLLVFAKLGQLKSKHYDEDQIVDEVSNAEPPGGS
jgi:hypothetical protein